MRSYHHDIPTGFVKEKSPQIMNHKHENKNNPKQKLYIKDLMTPCFIINHYSFKRNCDNMLQFVHGHNIHIRPHIKTHKTIQGCYIQATGHHYHNYHYQNHKQKLRRHNNNHHNQHHSNIKQDPSIWKYDDIVTGFVASTLPEISMIVQHVTMIHQKNNDNSQHHSTTNTNDNNISNDDDDHKNYNSSTNKNNSTNKLLPKAFYDILYGVPISEYKLQYIETLRQQFNKNNNGIIHILVDHIKQIDFIEQFVGMNNENLNTHQLIQPYSIYIKLDTGYHRAGITCNDRGIALAIKIIKSPYLYLQGVYSHCGHSYDENDSNKILDIVQTDYNMIQTFLLLLQQQELLLLPNGAPFNINDLIISIGSTPSSKYHPLLFMNNSSPPKNSIEIHPGNYVFYDRQQIWTNAIIENNNDHHHHNTNQIHPADELTTTINNMNDNNNDNMKESYLSGRLLSRVIGHYEDRNTILLDAGSLALSKDSTPQGYVCSIAQYPYLICTKLSQEVCIVTMKDSNMIFPYDEFPLGKLVILLPNHSCLAAACFDKYYIIHDPNSLYLPDEEVIDEWIPAKYFSI